jgi:hypothetical protein
MAVPPMATAEEGRRIELTGLRRWVGLHPLVLGVVIVWRRAEVRVVEVERQPVSSASVPQRRDVLAGGEERAVADPLLDQPRTVKSLSCPPCPCFGLCE